MYTLIRSVSGRQLLLGQAPSLGGAFVVAELFYKFHSFTLECLAFLLTWLVFDFVTSAIGARMDSRWSAAPVAAKSTSDG